MATAPESLGNLPFAPAPLVPLPGPTALLPDIASHGTAAAPGPIDRVGMERIDLPVWVRDGEGRPVRVAAEADVFVSLDHPDTKGIHMSRLFLTLQDVLDRDELGPATLGSLLEAFVGSHASISESAFVRVRFDSLVLRDALESDHRGWKRYPVELTAALVNGRLRLELATTVTYSSTCPCSAALSRELTRERFLERFDAHRPLDRDLVAAWLASEDGMPATPHSQRSHAEVRIALSPASSDLPTLALIDAVEASLGTPVQAAVKREDEQAFAALNGANLMFCEDAARHVRAALEAMDDVEDYRIHIRHEESLHPHDAVSVLCKGVEGGFTA